MPGDAARVNHEQPVLAADDLGFSSLTPRAPGRPLPLVQAEAQPCRSFPIYATVKTTACDES